MRAELAQILQDFEQRDKEHVDEQVVVHDLLLHWSPSGSSFFDDTSSAGARNRVEVGTRGESVREQKKSTKLANTPKQGKTAKQLGQEGERRVYHAEDTDAGERVKVHERARYDPNAIMKQGCCEHPYETLQCGANQDAEYAMCKTCGPRSALWRKLEQGDKKEQSTPQRETSFVAQTSMRFVECNEIVTIQLLVCCWWSSVSCWAAGDDGSVRLAVLEIE